ncbi:MAG: cyanophycinase [Bacteroidales bacterium]|nr:cyanophycinase [Bacteroidales bacterium]
MKSVNLVLIGGAEDKYEEMKILKKLCALVDYEDIVLIPTASYYPEEIADTYKEAFGKIGVKNLKVLDIRYRDECDRENNLNEINNAKLVFFSGGDQVKLLETLRGSALEKLIYNRYKKNKLIIAGTSAGAASASDVTLFDGDYSGFIKGKVKTTKGFGFIEEVIVDTHFLNRERLPRLIQVLAMNVEKKGIGIDENTAVFIDNNNNLEVVGENMVTLVNADSVTYNDYFDIEENKVYNINNVKIGFLSEGSIFNLKKWEIIKPQNNVYNLSNVKAKEIFTTLFS